MIKVGLWRGDAEDWGCGLVVTGVTRVVSRKCQPHKFEENSLMLVCVC